MRYNPLKNPSERSQIHNIRRTTALFIIIFIVICLIAAFVLIWSVSDNNNNGLFSLYSSTTDQLEKQQAQKEEKQETKQDIAQEPEGVGVSSSSFLEDEQKQQEQTNTTESTNTLDLTPDKEIDTSDWLTYRNEEYGFEFRYPREWQEWLWERQDPYQVDIIMSFDKLGDDPGFIMITQKSNLKENEPENSPLFSSKEEQQQYFREWNKKIYDEKYGYLTLEEWMEKHPNLKYKIILKNSEGYTNLPLDANDAGFHFLFANNRNQIFEFYWSQWTEDNYNTKTYYQLPYLLKSFTIF